MTRNIISRDGFEGFQPTACFPARRNIAVLAGLPDDVDVEIASLEWAAQKCAPGEEALVAFKISPSQFKIVRRHGSETQEATYSVAQE